MPTDPYVPTKLEDRPRQEPNLAPGVHMPPARSWRASRPGDLGPGQPEGAMLGSPGPNIGYALLLTTRMADRFQLAGEERRDDAVAVVAEIAMRRAASFGRAPVGHDVDFAAELLGYVGDVQLEIPEWRAHVVHHAAHDYPTRRFVVDAIPAGVLRLEVGELASRLAAIRDSLRSAVIRPTRA